MPRNGRSSSNVAPPANTHALPAGRVEPGAALTASQLTFRTALHDLVAEMPLLVVVLVLSLLLWRWRR